MNLTVVDSSVAFKWLCPHGEDHVEEASALLDDHAGGVILLAAPPIMRIEVANALRSSPMFGEDTTLALITELGTFGVEQLETTDVRLRSATALSYRHRISLYDALFLQLAEELDCPLVTADRRAFAGIDTPIEIRLL